MHRKVRLEKHDAVCPSELSVQAVSKLPLAREVIRRSVQTEVRSHIAGFRLLSVLESGLPYVAHADEAGLRCDALYAMPSRKQRKVTPDDRLGSARCASRWGDCVTLSRN